MKRTDVVVLALYRVLLRLYPPTFRARWGAEQLRTFRAQRRALAEASAGARARHTCGALADLIYSACAERLVRLRSSNTPEAAALRRENRRLSMWENLARDLRQAVRGLLRSRAFAVVAILTIALGVGANTAIFSVVRAVLLRPLPYSDPDRLMLVWAQMLNRNILRFPESPPDLKDMRDQTQLFERLEAALTFGLALTGDDADPAQIQVGGVTPGFLTMLGARPAHGRLFQDEDGIAPPQGTPPQNVPPTMVVLSDQLWRARFGADPGVVGRSIQLDGQRAIVVGVLEPGFALYMPPTAGMSDRIDAWSALRIDFVNAPRNNVFLRVVGRLKPGVTVTQAQTEMKGIAERIKAASPRWQASGYTIDVVPLHQDLTREVRPIVLALLGAVGFVLLIACANVSNLLLVRGSAREREMAVRAALGASRGRLLAQVLVESLVLALLGAALGILFASAGIRLLLALQPGDLPRIATVQIDGGVLAYTAAATLSAVLIFGLLPALQTVRPDLSRSLKERSVSAGTRRQGLLRGGVVVLEVALSLVLLIGAGLMLRSFAALRNVDPGFDTENVLTFGVPLGFTRYTTTLQRWQFGRELRAQIAALPGVQFVSAANPLPLAGQTFNGPYGPIEAVNDPTLVRQADIRVIAPGYFETMGTRLLQGRTFTEADMADSTEAVIVDRVLAEKLWPGESAVGKQIALRFWTADMIRVPVIGVVEHQRNGSLATEGRETLYYPDRLIGGWNTLSYVVRTTGDPMRAVAPIRQRLAALDSLLPMSDVRTMQSYVDEAMGGTRFALVSIGVFGVTALVLAFVGLYGVLAYAVRLRTAEIGVRMAFGAERSTILRMVVGQGLRLAAAGTVAGLLAARLLTRVLQSQLVGVAPTDSFTFLSVAAGFLAMAALACAVPALRATRVDPLVALREE
jgi:putative ABC transport system permease protein